MGGWMGCCRGKVLIVPMYARSECRTDLCVDGG